MHLSAVLMVNWDR